MKKVQICSLRADAERSLRPVWEAICQRPPIGGARAHLPGTTAGCRYNYCGARGSRCRNNPALPGTSSPLTLGTLDSGVFPRQARNTFRFHPRLPAGKCDYMLFKLLLTFVVLLLPLFLFMFLCFCFGSCVWFVIVRATVSYFHVFARVPVVNVHQILTKYCF